MFSDDSVRNDVTLLAVVVEEIKRRIRDIPVGSGEGGVDTNTLQRITGLEQTVSLKADASSLLNLAPVSGSTVYATQTQVATKASISDVTTALAGKANVTDVASALSSKSDSSHTHTGTYAPATGSSVYALKTEIPDISGKADVSDVSSALATKADANHHHDGVYASVQDTYTKAEVDSVFATKAEIPDISGGLTTTQGDQRYVLDADLFEKVTDIGDQAYAPINGSSVYALKTEIPDISGKADISDVAAALALKSDTTHNHSGVYTPVGTSYTKAESDAKYLTTVNESAYQTKANMVVVGAETTYYSKAKVDALLSALGGGAPKALFGKIGSVSLGGAGGWSPMRQFTFSFNNTDLVYDNTLGFGSFRNPTTSAAKLCQVSASMRCVNPNRRASPWIFGICISTVSAAYPPTSALWAAFTNPYNNTTPVDANRTIYGPTQIVLTNNTNTDQWISTAAAVPLEPGQAFQVYVTDGPYADAITDANIQVLVW